MVRFWCKVFGALSVFLPLYRTNTYLWRSRITGRNGTFVFLAVVMSLDSALHVVSCFPDVYYAVSCSSVLILNVTNSPIPYPLFLLTIVSSRFLSFRFAVFCSTVSIESTDLAKSR
jgi:hypothetical protein